VGVTVGSEVGVGVVVGVGVPEVFPGRLQPAKRMPKQAAVEAKITILQLTFILMFSSNNTEASVTQVEWLCQGITLKLSRQTGLEISN
jgi:hypothetical protein